MQSTSVATLGGPCSILVGVLYMVAGVIYLKEAGTVLLTVYRKKQ